MIITVDKVSRTTILYGFAIWHIKASYACLHLDEMAKVFKSEMNAFALLSFPVISFLKICLFLQKCLQA
jgi:hypothetical protein